MEENILNARITRRSVFDDLGLLPGEAKHLKIRSHLMIALEDYIQKHSLTQTEAAKAMGVSQPRISDLLNGKIDKFSIDQLVKMLERVSIEVMLVIDARLVA